MSRKSKALAVVLLGLVGLLAAVPWLVPLGQFIPKVEAEASRQLGMPVKIARLRLALLPIPQITATGVSAGAPMLAEIGRIQVRPNLFYLFSDTRVVNDVRLERVRVKSVLLHRLAGLRGAAQGSTKVMVRRITLKNVALRFEELNLEGLGGVIELDDSGVKQVRVHQRDDRLVVLATPASGEQFKLSVRGRKWTPPLGPSVVLDKVYGEGRITARGLSIPTLNVDLYGGTASGPLTVSWRPSWSVTGELKIQDVQLQPLVRVFSPEAPMSGRLRAQPRFDLHAREPADLIRSLTLRSDFSVEQGVLHRIDLVAIARNPLSHEASERGSTRFDRLTGRLEVDRQGYHFSNLVVESGLLAATGEVSVLRDQQLQGRVDAQVKGTGALLAVPLNVGGTLQAPRVMPSKTAMAGAVAGSVLLPGIGTAVGLKAGQLTEKLFGRRRDKNAPGRPTDADEGAASVTK